jgi:rare lipoprotein A
VQQTQVPPPPEATPLPVPAASPSPQKQPGTQGSTSPPVATNPPPGKSTPRPAPEEEITVPPNAKVLYKEVGWASWYGPGFQNRQAANGEVFDTERMTAAHRTLPLNSIVRVTNMKTNESALVRITDRGPFVGDRILDLSRAAALKLSVYQRGTALVRIEVLETPSPIETGGRWCVQIGGFTDHEAATSLKEKLTRRYHTAKILQFLSPTGDAWLRIRVAEDLKSRAQALMRETHTEAGMFLVRMD